MVYTELNKSFFTSDKFPNSNYNITRFTGGLNVDFKNNFFTKIGISVNKTIGGYKDNPISRLGSSINFDLGYNYNLVRDLNIGVFFRAQTMISAALYPQLMGLPTQRLKVLVFLVYYLIIQFIYCIKLKYINPS